MRADEPTEPAGPESRDERGRDRWSAQLRAELVAAAARLRDEPDREPCRRPPRRARRPGR